MDFLDVEKMSSHDAASIHTIDSNSDVAPRPTTPVNNELIGLNGSNNGEDADSALPATPAKPTKPLPSQTPRLKKKVPWKGKNILVLLPRDQERGRPGGPPMPLDATSTESMFRSWEQLGYDISGFDLDAHQLEETRANDSRSRDEWPLADDVVKERSLRQYRVTLPDLNAWRDYVNELAEAKLRALGVTFAEDEPAPPPSVSPGIANMSRQASNQFSPFPFSPPLPTSSAASNGQQGFPFQPPFFSGAPSASHSPGIPAVASPVHFGLPTPNLPGPNLPGPNLPGPNLSGPNLPGPNLPHPSRFARASISISPHELPYDLNIRAQQGLPFDLSGQRSPNGLPFDLNGQRSPLRWPSQMSHHQQRMGRGGGSPFNLMSPKSPFTPEGMSPMGMHQRHQSLQFPMLPHQFVQRQDSSRASPRLQEVREDEEETLTNPYDKSPSKTPEPSQFIQHNASNSLQKEIDEAEYHLEEQFRSQLEHEDYSPHNEAASAKANIPSDDFAATEPMHARGPSVHFSGIGTDSDEGPKLHHPQPHSRGHSLSQKPFYDNDEVRDSADEGSIPKPQTNGNTYVKDDDVSEIETNPSNLGTPAQTFDFPHQSHPRSPSVASNPWAESTMLPPSKVHSRHGSHQSKPSLSKLNAGAAEFKFNPQANSTPGQFVFGSTNPQASSFTPASIQAPAFVPTMPQSATSSHFSVPSTASSAIGKINPAAPAFSPHKSDFSFSTTGPKFNPDARAFQPKGSFAPSLASAGLSGNESAGTQPHSIFGKIELSGSEYDKPGKKSKAIPIVRPSSAQSRAPTPDAVTSAEAVSGGDERVDGGASRAKKLQFRNGDNEDGDDVPQFAEPTPEPEPLPQTQSEVFVSNEQESIKSTDSIANAIDEKDDDDEITHAADVTLASTVVSESTDGKIPSESNDTKTTTSPSATSPDPEKANWRPIEFTNESEIQDFNNARPFGDHQPAFDEPEKPHFSANARPFVPGSFTFGAADVVDTPFEPDFTTQPEQLVEPPYESEEDGGGSPTPGPDFPQTTGIPKSQDLLEDGELSPEPAHVSSRGLLSSRFALPPQPKGLKASRYATSPSASPEPAHGYEQLPVSPPSDAGAQPENDATHELTFEEIDAVMKQINENDPTIGVKRTLESPKRQEISPVRKIPITSVIDSPAIHLPPHVPSQGVQSPDKWQYQRLSADNLQLKPSTEVDDPFVDPLHGALSPSYDAPVQRLNTGEDVPESEWDDAFSASEQGKLEQRVQYFNGHVNRTVGHLLAHRLDPLENTLSSIQKALTKLSQSAPTARREMRSVSAEIQESDADDEDEELPMRRSASPKRDRRLEQIRVAVMDALNQQQTTRALEPAQLVPTVNEEPKVEFSMFKALEEMKLHFTESMSNFHGENLKNTVEEAVKSRMPPTPPMIVEDDEEVNKKFVEMQVKINDLEERLHDEEAKYRSERSRAEDLDERLRVGEARVETETATRRSAEDRSSELRRQLEQAETKVEVEIMNRSIFDQRIHDLEERLKTQESKTEHELSARREAEDRLSEIQRLLRISSEEEDRLRNVLDERDQRIKSIEQASGKTSMRLALLDAAQANAEQTQAELKNRQNVTDTELREARQEARHWRSEAEQARESAARQADDFVETVTENKHIHKLIDTLGVQLEENERIRENWRAKFVSLQADMAHAAREITEENSRRSKKEQTLLARQEVLDARLQAEARTRERLEVEVERLENGERAGMRAVSECKRLEGLLVDIRNENHDLHQQVLRSQRDAQEARDVVANERQSIQLEVEDARNMAASEVLRAQLETQETRESVEVEIQRAQLQILEAKDAAAAEVARAQQEVVEARNTGSIEAQQARESIAVELEAARDQVNIIKSDYEEEVAKLRACLDQVKLDADTANERHEMMIEEAHSTKETELQTFQLAKTAEFEDLARRHQNEIEDLHARYERQISNTTEDAQRTEQNLLERLSLSASKTEHLQDRVAHLEEKVQIAQEAAKAAAQAASQASKAVVMPEPSAHTGPAGQTKQLAQAMQLPEKISPQALRESIMVLQEQLQAREQRIEELEQKVSDLDPEAATKISKRDDEITWLRELLAVRHGDLQDIIASLSGDGYDREAVKDAAIRLKANLQMEEQERERAMNGGSALNLPNIAATISKAATPRVAQAVGPIAAAWGNWRRSNQSSLSLSGAMSSPSAGRNATPSKSNIVSSHGNRSGLMTPPTSGIRSTPLAEPSQQQPTAFGTTGRRFTAEQFANRGRGSGVTARQAEKMPLASTPPPKQERKDPRTPPMMRPNAYDDDARMEEFDDASFFDD
ncbi:hypothetical protein F4808DRAFT_374537 [Astrocystis sublimbata]|nr:hypothetical protein F4808DRAFT_374537 [Astrocystis sublimbata]